MKLRLALIPFLSALMVLALVTALYPPIDDFHPLNPQWNGMERVVEDFKAFGVRITDAYALDPLNHVLLIVGPSKPFTPEDARAVEAFLTKGGRVIVADDYGTANQLLELLGAPVRILPGVLTDPLLNIGSQHLPLARWGPRRVALNYAAALNTSACLNCKILAESSLFSYLDLNVNGRHDDGEPGGPLPIAISLRYGAGELIVVSDSSLFINSMINRESNRVVFEELLKGAQPAVIVNFWRETTFTKIKGGFMVAYRLLGSPEIKYSLAVAVFALSIREGRRLASKRE
ncbi:MAG: DUF4350 domain-containing protein [Thermofilaceae archaeon]